MGIIATKNDNEAQLESGFGVADACKDREGEQYSSSNTGLAEELDLATAPDPLSGWRFAAVAFS
jgi:hypothetical protein